MLPLITRILKLTSLYQGQTLYLAVNVDTQVEGWREGAGPRLDRKQSMYSFIDERYFLPYGSELHIFRHRLPGQNSGLLDRPSGATTTTITNIRIEYSLRYFSNKVDFSHLGHLHTRNLSCCVNASAHAMSRAWSKFRAPLADSTPRVRLPDCLPSTLSNPQVPSVADQRPTKILRFRSYLFSPPPKPPSNCIA